MSKPYYDIFIADIDKMIDTGIENKKKFIKYCNQYINIFMNDLHNEDFDLDTKMIIDFRIKYLKKAIYYINKN